MTRPLGDKLAAWDRACDDAYLEVVSMLRELRPEILIIARARHVSGHYLYGDRHYAEWDAGRLRCETLKELADAINYACRLIQLERGES